MDEPCDICGATGYPEVILTCCKCRIAREHVYCMRKYILEVPEDWICESCEAGDAVLKHYEEHTLHTTGESSVNCELEPHAHSKMRRLCKVKFIPTEEVIKLSSATTKGLTSTSVAGRTHSVSKTITAVCAPLSIKTNPSLGPSEQLNSPRLNGMQIKSMSSQQPRQASQESKVSKKKAPSASNNTHLEQKRLAGLLASGKESKTSKKVMDNTLKKRSCAASTSRNNSPIYSSLKEGFDHKFNDLPNFLPNINLYRCYLPALHATWKGGFVFLDTVIAGKFYGGFQAQPPCRVHRKAYKFSQKLPAILQVKLLPRSHADLFQDDSPDLRDIALYFFPSNNIERSQENNTWLFDLMETENSIIRSYIDGVELLIFTSKLLHVDSQNDTECSPDVITKLNTECLLLGVFRHAKNDQALYNINGESSYACSGNENKNHIGDVDMEIDRLGGKHVSTVDIACTGTSCNENINEKLSQKHDEMCPTFSKEIDFKMPLKSSPASSSNIMDNIDLPPGFEKMIREKRNVLGEATVRDGNPLLLGGKIAGSAKEIISESASSRRFGAPISPDLLVSMKNHQEPSHGEAADCIPVAYPSPLSVKANSRLGSEAGNNNDRKSLEREKFPELETQLQKPVPLRNRNGSQNSTFSSNEIVSPRVRDKYLRLSPTGYKTELQKRNVNGSPCVSGLPNEVESVRVSDKYLRPFPTGVKPVQKFEHDKSGLGLRPGLKDFKSQPVPSTPAFMKDGSNGSFPLRKYSLSNPIDPAMYRKDGSDYRMGGK